MKRVAFVLLLLWVLCIPSYVYAELAAPTGVKATEGEYSNAILVTWPDVTGATSYEVWRDSYAWCEGKIPCEPEFILWAERDRSDFWDRGEGILPYGEVFEYKIKACTNDEITNEYTCSDFSLPTYGYILEDAPEFNNTITYTTPSGGSTPSSMGIFGDIFRNSVIGYHLDGFTAEGLQVYMPVTQGIKALKGAQEYVRSFAPALAEFVRECFDYLEQKADANKEGSLYNLGTHVFPVLGKIAEGCLRLLGQEDYMNEAYVSTTIGVEEFKKLKSEGRAIAPKIVKEVVNLAQEEGLLSLLN